MYTICSTFFLNSPWGVPLIPLARTHNSEPVMKKNGRINGPTIGEWVCSIVSPRVYGDKEYFSRQAAFNKTDIIISVLSVSDIIRVVQVSQSRPVQNDDSYNITEPKWRISQGYEKTFVVSTYLCMAKWNVNRSKSIYIKLISIQIICTELFLSRKSRG